MPKKSTAARGTAQRNKPKTQKSFELVRPVSEQAEASSESEKHDEATPVQSAKSTATITEEAPKAVKSTTTVTEETPKTETKAPAKGSASARLAARRLASQKQQQRNAAALITSEHYAYVRRDLVSIAAIASFMFIAIIVLYFVLGRTS